MHGTAEKDPRQESPLSAWTGMAMEKDRPKRPSDHQLQEAWKESHYSCGRGSSYPCTVGTARVPASQAAVPPSCSTLTGAELPQAKKPFVYVRRVTSVMSNSLQPLDCGLPGFSVWEVGFSRQEYWSVLANTGGHTLLEHYTSCCLSRQLPWVPGAAKTPVT